MPIQTLVDTDSVFLLQSHSLQDENLRLIFQHLAPYSARKIPFDMHSKFKLNRIRLAAVPVVYVIRQGRCPCQGHQQGQGGRSLLADVEEAGHSGAVDSPKLVGQS